MMFFTRNDPPVPGWQLVVCAIIAVVAVIWVYVSEPTAQEKREQEIQKIADEMYLQDLAKLPAGTILLGKTMPGSSDFCMKTMSQKDGTFRCNIFNSPIMLDVKSAVMDSHLRLKVVALPPSTPSVWEKTVAANAFQVEISQ